MLAGCFFSKSNPFIHLSDLSQRDCTDCFNPLDLVMDEGNVKTDSHEGTTSNNAVRLEYLRFKSFHLSGWLWSHDYFEVRKLACCEIPISNFLRPNDRLHYLCLAVLEQRCRRLVLPLCSMRHASWSSNPAFLVMPKITKLQYVIKWWSKIIDHAGATVHWTHHLVFIAFLTIMSFHLISIISTSCKTDLGAWAIQPRHARYVSMTRESFLHQFWEGKKILKIASKIQALPMTLSIKPFVQFV